MPRLVPYAIAGLTLLPSALVTGQEAARESQQGRLDRRPNWKVFGVDDPAVLWRAEVGSAAAEPVPLGDRVLIGTNNDPPRAPGVTGDGGVLMCLDDRDGSLLWRSFHPRMKDRVNDVPMSPLRSRPAVRGDRVYYLSNRAVMTCVDLEGFRDGENDGRVRNEPRTDQTDADVVWEVDFVNDHGVYKRVDAGMGSPTSSPLILGDLVFCCTGQGTTYKGAAPNSEAPSFAAMRLTDGEIVWTSAAPGKNVVLGHWSSPAALKTENATAVLFPGGDGVLYAFEPTTGRQLWSLPLDSEPRPVEKGLRDLNDRSVFIGDPVVSGGTIYVGLSQKYEVRTPRRPVYAIEVDSDALHPQIRWAFEPDGKCASPPRSVPFDSTQGSVAVSEDAVFVLGKLGLLAAADRETGAVRWRMPLFDHASLYASPVLRDDLLYVPGAADLLVFKGTTRGPTKVGTYMPNRMIYDTPAVTSNALYLPTSGTLWKLKRPQELLDRPE